MNFTRRWTWLILAVAGWVGSSSTAQPQVVAKNKTATLAMSKAIACKRIDAYEKYTILPDASLTSDDKLQVYYKPSGFKIEPVEKPKPGFRYRARFSQDFRIRKKGEKAIVSKKDKVLEYDPAFNDPTQPIYMVNSIGLKGIPPGDYELDIILRDVLTEGLTATQSLSFTILPLPKIDPAKVEGPDEPEGSPSPKTESKSSTKPRKKTGSR